MNHAKRVLAAEQKMHDALLACGKGEGNPHIKAGKQKPCMSMIFCLHNPLIPPVCLS